MWLALVTGWSIDYIMDELGRKQVIAIYNRLKVVTMEQTNAVSVNRILDHRVAVEPKPSSARARIGKLQQPVAADMAAVPARALQAMGLKREPETPLAESDQWERMDDDGE